LDSLYKPHLTKSTDDCQLVTDVGLRQVRSSDI